MAKIIPCYSIKKEIGILGFASERIISGSRNGRTNENKNKIKKRMEEIVQE